MTFRRAAAFLFDASGRTERSPFVLGLAGWALGLCATDALADRVPVEGGAGLAAWVLRPILFVVGCTLLCRRLHDLGLSGWWTALLASAFLATGSRPEGLAWLVAPLILVAALGLCLAPGQARPNRFGPPTRPPYAR